MAGTCPKIKSLRSLSGFVFLVMAVTEAFPPLTEGDHRAIICHNILKLDCSLFFESFHCGTDGVTYNNTCQFAQGHCRSPTLHVRHMGACHPDSVTDGTGTQSLSAVLALVCDDIVHVDCTRQPSQPLCASDGNVYQNHCFFEQARCTSHGTLITALSVEHAGQC